MPFANSSLLWFLAAVFVSLVVGTVVRLIALRRAPIDLAKSRLGSLKTWWMLAGLLSLGWNASVAGINRRLHSNNGSRGILYV